MAQEGMLLIGGPRHGQEEVVSYGVDSLATDHEGREVIYHRRTMRFVARSPINPRSVSLRRYYTADVLVHELIADDPAEAYAWWQSLADQRLFEAHGVEVTGDPEEVARFRAAPSEPYGGQ